MTTFTSAQAFFSAAATVRFVVPQVVVWLALRQEKVV
jgi:hypothetical protein